MALNISAYSIRQPIPSIVLFTVLCFLGWMSYRNLPITRFPNIDVPLIQVTVAQAGAASAMPQPRSGPSRVTVCGSSGGIQPAEPGASDHVPCEVRVVSRPRSTQISWAR